MLTATAVIIAGLSVATSSANATAYTFTTIDVPGASSTSASGINNAGQIVGSYSAMPDPSSSSHGFLYMDGNITILDVPGAVATNASGINDEGQIVGIFSAIRLIPPFSHGFLYNSGNYTQIDVPPEFMPLNGAGVNGLNDINNEDQIVGVFSSNGASGGGFLASGTNFTVLDVLGRGINDLGQILAPNGVLTRSMHEQTTHLKC